MIRKIAHRGVSSEAPENTLAAFRLVRERGVGAVEFDVRASADGIPVVVHDADLRRLAGKGDRVGDLSAADLRATDVGSWFDPRFAEEGVPSLKQALEAVSGCREIHVEVKDRHRDRPGLARAVLDAVEEGGLREKAVISSFDPETLLEFRALDSRVRIGYLVPSATFFRAFSDCEKLAAESLHLSARRVNARWVRRARDAGMKVLVYTVNDQETSERLEALGVEALFSDGTGEPAWFSK